MKASRVCVNCEKGHNTCLENKDTNEIQPLTLCLDCLMAECAYNYEFKQLTLDDVEGLTYNELQLKLETVLMKLIPSKCVKIYPENFPHAIKEYDEIDSDGVAIDETKFEWCDNRTGEKWKPCKEGCESCIKT